MTQNIHLEAGGVEVVYWFAVDPSDRHMLDNQLDQTILAIRYLRDKDKVVSFNFEDRRSRFGGTIEEELSHFVKPNASESQWHRTEESFKDLDFGRTEILPKDFPLTLVRELAEKGGFLNLFKSRCPNFNRKIEKSDQVYMEVRLDSRIHFDFKIDESEEFDINNIKVMRDWVQEKESNSCWRLGIMYNDRYISASAIVSSYNRYWPRIRTFYPQTWIPIKWKNAKYDGVCYDVATFEEIELPFIDDMLSLANSK